MGARQGKKLAEITVCCCDSAQKAPKAMLASCRYMLALCKYMLTSCRYMLASCRYMSVVQVHASVVQVHARCRESDHRDTSYGLSVEMEYHRGECGGLNLVCGLTHDCKLSYPPLSACMSNWLCVRVRACVCSRTAAFCYCACLTS